MTGVNTFYILLSMMTETKLRKNFPPSKQLSLMGLDLCYVEFETVREYVINLAHKRLRRALRLKGGMSLAWHEATTIADTDLINTLRSRGKVDTARECPPWVGIRAMRCPDCGKFISARFPMHYCVDVKFQLLSYTELLERFNRQAADYVIAERQSWANLAANQDSQISNLKQRLRKGK